MSATRSRKGKGSNPRLPTGPQPVAPPSLTRAERKAIIDEDAKHVLEELWGYEPDDVFYKVFKRESKTGGVDDILALSKKDILELSCRDDSTSTAIHASKLDAGRIRMLLFYQNHLHEQGLHPDDGSFRFTSITFEDCKIFRTHPDNKTRAS